MTYAIAQAIQVSLGKDVNGTVTTNQADWVWYKLSDHNRQPLDITYNLIESTDRMANGTLRKFIVARKFVIAADWKDFPTLDSNLVDYSSTLGDVPANAKAGAWIKAFYEGNAFNPIYVKLIFAKETPVLNSVPSASTYKDSQHTDGQIYSAFMTTFTYNVTKRRVGPDGHGYDYVDLKIEFTEI
jgi:hypothetical protein